MDMARRTTSTSTAPDLSRRQQRIRPDLSAAPSAPARAFAWRGTDKRCYCSADAFNRLRRTRNFLDVHFWTPTAPCLVGPFCGEIKYLARVDVEHYVTPAGVRVLDRHRRRIFLVNLSAGEVRDEDNFPCHFEFLSPEG
jgi:hypothetical protein